MIGLVGDGVELWYEIIFAEENANQHPPLGEVGGGEVKGDRDMGANAGDFDRGRGRGMHEG